MKKNMVRILAFVLVLILALGLLPMAAFAATNATIYKEGYNDKKPTVDTFFNDQKDFGTETRTSTGTSVTVKSSEFSSLVSFGDFLYDLQGFVDSAKTQWSDPDAPLQYTSSVTLKDGEYATLGYALHGHKLTCWIYDGTTHFKHCTVCGEQFVYQSWHVDQDENRFCDICGGEIPYHDIVVVDSEGGKVTADRETAPYRTRVNVSVEPASGYALKKVRFFKVRDDGSKQEIVRHENAGGFYFEMPTYDVEIVADFIKK